jgi:hypothetical protein
MHVSAANTNLSTSICKQNGEYRRLEMRNVKALTSYRAIQKTQDFRGVAILILNA